MMWLPWKRQRRQADETATTDGDFEPYSDIDVERAPEDRDRDDISMHTTPEVYTDEDGVVADNQEQAEAAPQQKKKRPIRRYITYGLTAILFIGLINGLIFRPPRRHITPPPRTGPKAPTFRPPPNKPSPPTGTAPKNAKPSNFALNFPYFYPPLSSPADSPCATAWQALTAVPCHEKIWDRSKDNGTIPRIPSLGTGPQRYVPLMCEERCTSALEAAYKDITAKCSASDVFFTKGYDGHFGLAYLEAGPVAVMDTLYRRNKHTCRKSPFNDAEGEFCLIDLDERYALVDGMNAQTLNGLGRFLSETDRRRTEPAHWKQGSRGTSRDGGWRQRYRYWVPLRTSGPGTGETTCGWCTLNWLERKVKSWEEGVMVDPVGKEAVGLEDFLHAMWEGGHRCEREGWNRIWKEAVEGYVAEGMLPEGYKTPNSTYTVPHRE